MPWHGIPGKGQEDSEDSENGEDSEDDEDSVAVIASSPKGYAAHAADAVATLREAGVPTIFVAGRAKELGATSVDGEIYDGMDVVAFLSGLLDRLGAPAEGAL